MVLNPFNKKSTNPIKIGNIFNGLKNAATDVLDLINYDTKMSNDTNMAIANKNFGLQQQMFEYNQALQNKIFEREDTAYQRTAQDMIATGLNPLSMQGTDNAGEAIASDTPQINYQNQKYNTGANIMSALQTFAGIKSTFDQLKTNQLQRDSLALENDKKKYELILDGLKHGIKINFGKDNEIYDDIFDSWYENQKKKLKEEGLTSDYNIRNMQHDIDTNRYPSDSEIDRALTSIIDWIASGRGEEAWYKLVNENPFVQSFADAINSISDYKFQFPKRKKDEPQGTTKNSSNSSNKSGKF